MLYDEVNSKIMNLRGIQTKSKEEFLQAEREWFPSMTREEYYKYMVEDVDSCKNCGTVFWKDCNKRCDCS